MLKFLAANMGLVDTPLKAAMDRMRSVRPLSTGQPHEDIAMAWFVWSEFLPDIYMHVGGTLDYRSFAGMDITNKKAVLVLGTSNFWIPDVIGWHLLRSAQFPAPMLEKMNEGIGFDAKTLSEYKGVYELQFSPTIPVTFTEREERLFAQMSGQPEGEVLRSSKDEIFWREGETKATFTRDSKGKVTGIVVHQNELHVLGPRAKQ